MDISQVMVVDMGIDLRRGNACMTKECLYSSEISSSFEKTGCKAVSECVRSDFFGYACVDCIIMDDSFDCVSRKWFAKGIICQTDKDCF
jgi:hypothetical protein